MHKGSVESNTNLASTSFVFKLVIDEKHMGVYEGRYSS